MLDFSESKEELSIIHAIEDIEEAIGLSRWF